MALRDTPIWTSAAVRALSASGPKWPRYELLDGTVHVTPAPRVEHQIAISELFAALFDFVKLESLGLLLTSPSDIELRPDTLTQPDLFIVPAETHREGHMIEWSDIRRLVLAVEVISPATARLDRGLKREFYLANGCAEYWVMSVEDGTVERWLAGETVPSVHRTSLLWTPSGTAPFELDLISMFERIDRGGVRMRH